MIELDFLLQERRELRFGSREVVLRGPVLRRCAFAQVVVQFEVGFSRILAEPILALAAAR